MKCYIYDVSDRENEFCNNMVLSQLPADTTGAKLLWSLIEQLSHNGGNLSPTTGNGYGVAWQALIVLLVLLVLAIISLCGALLYIFRRWERGQATGIKALATNKDNTKREITELLKAELGNARAANAADIIKIESILTDHGKLLGLVILDLAIVGHEIKIPMRSSPSQIETKDPKP